MRKCNNDIVNDIISLLPSNKKDVLKRALDRNFILTSSYVLSWCDLYIYKEGWYLVLTGTRVKFSCWVFDNDGTFIFGRKPLESKLHFLYKDSGQMNESDFDNI